VNILPLVFTFLIIFSCISLTFLREVKSFSLIETSLDGYNRTQRGVSNAIARNAYRKIKADPAKKNASDKTKVASGEYHSKRCLFPPVENSKLNLRSLIKQQQDCKRHPLYEPLAKLMRLLYQKSVFEKEKSSEKLEYRLIDEMVKKARKLVELKSFAEICPDDPALRKIYYKMLKGTNQYSRSEGIPPLSHFLSLSKAEKEVSLSFASPPILDALFGQEISSTILEVEREKWEQSNKYYFFSKEDLEALLLKSPTKAPFLALLEPHLDYSKQPAPRNQIAGRDKITGIAVELELISKL
jgi:hypothetical protein